LHTNIRKIVESLARKLQNEEIPTPELHRAYDLATKLRSQLLGVIYEREQFGANESPKLADTLTDGAIADDTVILTIREPLPPQKELTAAMCEHWLELVHTAIGKAACEQKLPRFGKAFVWIKVVTPRGTNNANLWDTSNRAVNLVINNLKGVFFEDDNLEHMAFGVTGSWGEKGATIVHIMPFE
jgi:hypothetical protein